MFRFCTPESLKRFEASIEKSTGHKTADLRGFNVCETRRRVEERTGKPVTTKSRFPTIGRGNVLGDCVIDRARVDQLLDEVLSQ